MSSDQWDGLEDQGNRVDGISHTGREGRDTDELFPNLLTMDKDALAKRLLADWNASNRHVKSIKEQWKVNRARAKGFTGVALIKQQDENRAYIPVGARQSIAGMNKAARLKRRLRATMFADEAKPDAVPSSDEDEDRDSAEMSTRVLEDLTSEGNLHLHQAMGDGFDLGSDYGSGFLRFWVDEQGGGNVPEEIEATPAATSAQQPFVPDPITGQMVPTLRYVMPDGTLTDEPGQANRIWLPKIRMELLTGRHVRFLPHTTRDLWEADGVMVGAMVPLSAVLQMFPALADLPEDKRGEITQGRPEDFKDLMPVNKRETGREQERYVFVLSRYHVQSPEYPKGAYIIAVGNGYVVHRGVWFDEENDKPLDIPLTQIAQYHEEDNPYHQGLMELLGPGNEVRSLVLGSFLEHLDKFLNRRVFLPLNSVLRPEQLQMPTGGVLQVNPGGAPAYEELPDFPSIAEKMYTITTADLDDESGLQEAAQGLAPDTVKSGIHAQQIVEQVIVGLSELRQNVQRAYVRAWRILLQLVRAYYTVPQKLRWVGEDGRYKVEEWTGSDLGTTQDVRLARGTFTQLSPVHKANLALQYFQVVDEQGNRLLSLSDVQHLLTGNVGGYLGLRDDPHRNRVRRQISEFMEGPPQGWQPPPPQVQVDPMTGQQRQVQPPDPVLQKLAGIWEPLPVDAEPMVARLRAEELGRALAGSRIRRFHPLWRQSLAQAYEQARAAAGIVTVQEQQQAMMQQQQAQQQAEAQKAEAPVRAKQMDQRQRMAERQMDMQAAAQSEQADAQKARAEAEQSLMDAVAASYSGTATR